MSEKDEKREKIGKKEKEKQDVPEHKKMSLT